MTRLEILASLVMDAYYQSYAKESDFLQQEDFVQYTGMFYQQVLQEDFDKTRRELIQLRMLDMNESIILSDSWYKIKEVDVKKDGDNFIAEMPNYFSFNRDISFSGLKAVYPIDNVGDCCNKFAKIKSEQCNGLAYLPSSDKTIYYFPLGDKIYFKKVNCNLKKVNVAYIPSINENEDENTEISIPEGLIADIVIRTYSFLTSTRNGLVIDKTNDQNQNRSAQTEIDPNSIQNQ